MGGDGAPQSAHVRDPNDHSHAVRADRAEQSLTCLRAGANTVETLIVWVVIAIVAVIILHRKYNLVDLFEAWRERPTPPPLRRTPEEKAFWLVIFVAFVLCALWYW